MNNILACAMQMWCGVTVYDMMLHSDASSGLVMK